MTQILKSYVCGAWFEGEGKKAQLKNPTTEETLAETSTAGINFAEALDFARSRGGEALRAMTFAERGAMLMAMSKAIHEYREELLDLAEQNGGNTRSDAKFDIDGATGTLAFYAKLGEKMGDKKVLADGDAIQLTRNPRWVGQHVYTPRRGVAVLINAFNFPAWGFAEKAACALLAGMPVINKPATSTSLVAARITEILVESGVMPEGTYSAVTGSAGDMLDHVGWQDVIAFTGSSDTGLFIRSRENILKHNVRVNVEADSLNAAVLGADLNRESETYDLFLQEAVRDMTQKAGQKCTAIRRILVPKDMLDEVREDLINELSGIRAGNPTEKGVRVGPLATEGQLRDAKEGLERLSGCTKMVYGDGGRGNLTGIDHDKGYFMSPVLLEAEDARSAAIHDREIFGPVSTILPYDGTAEEAAELLGMGQGSLVSSIYSDKSGFALEMVERVGAFNGRLHLASKKMVELSAGPGTVLPTLMHGGPGRAGGGEELGGERGLAFYMQRTAVQGYQPLLEKLS